MIPTTHATFADNTVDAQTRQRLADMFIGGSGTIQCRRADGQLQTVSYTYPGFQQTQLVMPYGGVQKSSRYVASRRPDVGIRHDCLGDAFHTDGLMEKIGDVISDTWRQAPLVFELCPNGSTANSTFIANAADILRRTHASIVHDNLPEPRSAEVLNDLMAPIGYRYTLNAVDFTQSARPNGTISLRMNWTNVGYAPSYPRMGQDLKLHFLLVDRNGITRYNWLANADVSSWMPADPLPGTPPANWVIDTLPVPADFPQGVYIAKVAIIEGRTGQAINLHLSGRDGQGRYTLGLLTISDFCPGDVNGDGVVDSLDVQLMASVFRNPASAPASYDLVGGDGLVTMADVMLVASQFGRQCF